MTKIGVIKEGKTPIDRRVPVTPSQAKVIQEKFNVNIAVQSSSIRCFSDDHYQNEGIEVVDTIKDCDIIMGVKEVPIDKLVADKTYFLLFTHH